MQETMQRRPAIESLRGTIGLMMANCAGLLDLIALPLWVGILIEKYHFNPQQAGSAPTLFLIGAALASLFFAPRLNRMDAKRLVVGGFVVAAVVFAVCSRVATIQVMGPLHFLAGLAAGTALSFTHGTIGHARNPHRIFAIAALAVGIFGIVFLGGTPGVLVKFGGSVLFVVFASTMALAALVTVFCFPRPEADEVRRNLERLTDARPIPRAAWVSIVAISLMATTQGMTFSFYERIGMARGFGHDPVTLALVAYGIVTLFPSPLAALLEKRIRATTVISTMPLLQAVCAMTITHTSNYVAYAVSGALMGFTIIFTHIYAFGLLARLDPSGRVVAGTPAMLMVGAAIAPFLGGTLVRFIGFEAVGVAACVLVAIELLLFNYTRRATGRRSSSVQLPQAT